MLKSIIKRGHAEVNNLINVTTEKHLVIIIITKLIIIILLAIVRAWIQLFEHG